MPDPRDVSVICEPASSNDRAERSKIFPMRIVTYNIHKARGMDGRVSIKRIAEVLGDLDADIIALQEIFSESDSKEGQVETLATALGMKSIFGCTRHHRGRPYGNALLSRWPIVSSCGMDLTWAHRERRGCIRVDLKTSLGTLHVFNIHMGTSYFERRHQVKSLLASKQIYDDISGPRVLVGDFNEWIKGLTTRMLSDRFESLNLELHIRKRRSYPGFLPLMHLDHIYFERPLRVEKAELVRNRRSRIASDHLPLVATFGWEEL
jgi:endonuclease/exonuclease/phosphatase family metal-dependent hydrolase